MYMTSASADFDLDYHDEEVMIYAFKGGPLQASIKYAPAGEPMYTVVRVFLLSKVLNLAL